MHKTIIKSFILGLFLVNIYSMDMNNDMLAKKNRSVSELTLRCDDTQDAGEEEVNCYHLFSKAETGVTAAQNAARKTHERILEDVLYAFSWLHVTNPQVYGAPQVRSLLAIIDRIKQNPELINVIGFHLQPFPQGVVLLRSILLDTITATALVGKLKTDMQNCDTKILAYVASILRSRQESEQGAIQPPAQATTQAAIVPNGPREVTPRTGKRNYNATR